MKHVLKRGVAILLVALIIVSALCISSFAAVSRPSANLGTRGQACTTFDGTNALSYYTGEYTYDKLSDLSANALLLELRELMSDTHHSTSSYTNCRNYSGYTDGEGGDYTHFTTLYSSYSFAYTEGDNCSGWNREHVWPKSLGGFGESGGGADLHHIRPTEQGPNGTRGNNPYGEVDGGTPVYGNLSGNLAGYSGGGYFEPLDYAKGDVARICLYVYVRWGGTSGYTCDDVEIVFESIDTLLEWCALDPVDTWEMERNDSVQGVQGNRNVFIDYPELAWQLFGRSVPADLTSPSDDVANAPGGNTGGGSDSDDNETDTPDAPVVSTTAPVVGTEYNLTVTLSSGDVYYVGKTISSKTFSAVSNRDDAAVFGVEKTSSGDYVLYFKNAEGAKKYVAIADAAQGFSAVDSKDGATPLKWFAEKETLVAADSDNNRWFGTSGAADFRSYVITGNFSFAKFAPLSTGDNGDTGSGEDDTETPVYPNPDDEIGGGTGDSGSTGGSDTETGEVVFELGENGSSHSDGSDATGYTETVGDYTLNITGGTKFYKNACDAQGNSAIKLGSGSSAGHFTFVVPDEVDSVIIKIAGYKANTAKLSINGTSYTVTTFSANGEYTDITVDTSTEKTVSVSTVSGGYRAMINSITFVLAVESGSGGCDSGNHNYGDEGYCKTCQVGFRTATLVLSEDLALRYGVEVESSALLEMGAPTMKFMFDGKTYEVDKYTISSGRYIFVFDGISPDEMTLLINAEFYLGGVKVASFNGYSVETNLVAIRDSNSSNAALVQLVNDTLLYGQAAQNYTGKNSSDLAGNGVENLVASDAAPSDEDVMCMVGNQNADIRFSSVGVHFDCVNSIFIKVYVSDVSLFGSVKVGNKSYALSELKDLGDGSYRLDLDPVKSTEFGNTVNITLIGSDNTEYASVTYSINSYAYAMVNGGSTEEMAMYNLALALYRYGKSSVAYCLAEA